MAETPETPYQPTSTHSETVEVEPPLVNGNAIADVEMANGDENGIVEAHQAPLHNDELPEPYSTQPMHLEPTSDAPMTAMSSTDPLVPPSISAVQTQSEPHQSQQLQPRGSTPTSVASGLLGGGGAPPHGSAQVTAAAAGVGNIPSLPLPPASAQGSPTRMYINSKITPLLLEGMKWVAKNEPEKPLKWLSEFLEQKSREIEGT